MHVNEIAEYVSCQPDFELLGASDVLPEVPENNEKRYTRAWNLKNISEKWNVKTYASYLEMLDEVKPYVAFVLTENYRKHTVAEEIAKRGINLIIEKPMAMDSAEAESIVALKEKYGVEIFVNWPVTWRPYVRDFKAALDSGKYGKLLKLRYINGHTGPLGKGAKHRGVSATAEEMTDEERARTWWHKSECGGGAYLDILCYGAYFSRWVTGKCPDEVMAVGQNLNTPFGNTEDNVAAIMKYDGAFTVCEGTWTTPRRRMPAGPEAVLADGVVWCEGKPDGTSRVCACDIYGKTKRPNNSTQCDDFKNIAWQYAAHVKRGLAMHETLTAEFNRDVVAIIEAARESGNTGKAVKPKKA